MKSSTYYFRMKSKILADLQICICAPLRSQLKRNFDNNKSEENSKKYKQHGSYCVKLLRKMKMEYFQNMDVNKVNDNKNILPQCPGWNHPGKFLGENLFRKITSRRKAFGFFTSPTILHNLFHLGKNTPSLIVPSEFFDFTQWVLILPLWYYWYSLLCGNISLESRQCEVTLPPEI